ncbi:MAG: hypothetical protein ACJ768_09065 [Gaiellaceae bacterium]
MTTRSRSPLAAAVLAVSAVVPLLAAGSAAADLSVPTAIGGTVQQHTTGHRAVVSQKMRHHRLHRSGHHRHG